MTEPLKPRIDFDGPLEVDQNQSSGRSRPLTKIRRKILPQPRSMKRRKKRGKLKR